MGAWESDLERCQGNGQMQRPRYMRKASQADGTVCQSCLSMHAKVSAGRRDACNECCAVCFWLKPAAAESRAHTCARDECPRGAMACREGRLEISGSLRLLLLLQPQTPWGWRWMSTDVWSLWGALWCSMRSCEAAKRYILALLM